MHISLLLQLYHSSRCGLRYSFDYRMCGGEDYILIMHPIVGDNLTVIGNFYFAKPF